MVSQNLGDLLSKHSSKDLSSNVHVQVYLTGDGEQNVDLSNKIPEDPATSKLSASPTDKINIDIHEEKHDTTILGRVFGGRPQLSSIVQEEAAKVAEAGQSLGVFVCGPTVMQNDVRNAVAKEN